MIHTVYGAQPPAAISWRQCWPLGALTGAVLVLAATGVLPTWPGLLHLVALPPLDAFTDLRVLILLAPSWWSFAVLLVVVLGVRVVVLAQLVGGLTRANVRFAAVYYAIVLVPSWFCAFFVTTGVAVHYARFFWPAVGLVALLAMLWFPTPWQGTTSMREARRRTWRGGLRLELTLPYTIAVIGLGALADQNPEATLVLVPVSAFLTAAVVRAMARPAVAHPRALMAGAAVAALVTSVFFVATREPGPMPADGPPRDGSLVVVGGINSRSGHGSVFNVQPDRLGYRCEQVYYYSFAGPGDGQPQGQSPCPATTGAPYVPTDTHRPLAEQVELFAQQTDGLPRPLTVLAQSYSGWLVWEALATGAAEADEVLLLGPFPHSAIGYLPAGSHGQGQVFSDLLRAFAPAANLVDFHFDPKAPAAQELLASRTAAQRILGQPLPGDVRGLSLTVTTDLPLMPDGWRLDVEVNACPLRTPHPYVPLSPLFYREALAFFAGEPQLGCPGWRDWGAPVTRPFGPPPGAGGAWDEL